VYDKSILSFPRETKWNKLHKQKTNIEAHCFVFHSSVSLYAQSIVEVHHGEMFQEDLLQYYWELDHK
jgi:hypothetical protein